MKLNKNFKHGYLTVEAMAVTCHSYCYSTCYCPMACLCKPDWLSNSDTNIIKEETYNIIFGNNTANWD